MFVGEMLQKKREAFFKEFPRYPPLFTYVSYPPPSHVNVCIKPSLFTNVLKTPLFAYNASDNRYDDERINFGGFSFQKRPKCSRYRVERKRSA
jgi:hypothetical protein